MSNERDRDVQAVCRTTAGFPCVDGPLVGEFHQQGESFEFEGACAGLESGWYRLQGAVYVWEPQSNNSPSSTTRGMKPQ